MCLDLLNADFYLNREYHYSLNYALKIFFDNDSLNHFYYR